MMLLDYGVPQCSIVLTVVGKCIKSYAKFCFRIVSHMHGLIILLQKLRLFSCGTSKEGESFLVEWNESEGAIKRSYVGFRKKSAGIVQFDTTRNRFLAVGEDNQIKFWDMDSTNMLTSTEAEGGLSVSIILIIYSFNSVYFYYVLISFKLQTIPDNSIDLIFCVASESSSVEIQQRRQSARRNHSRQWTKGPCKL